MINIFIDNFIFLVSLYVVSAYIKLVVDVLIRDHCIADSTILVVSWIVVDGGVVLVSLAVGVSLSGGKIGCNPSLSNKCILNIT